MSADDWELFAVFDNKENHGRVSKVSQKCYLDLTHYSPVLLFYIPENIRKPKSFLMLSAGIEKQHRAVMG